MPNSFSGIGNWEIKDQDWRDSKQGINDSITALQQTVANFGSYATAYGVPPDNHPDVAEPNTKTIYLVKDDSILSGDSYKEWICTDVETSAYELIGDTNVDLSDYYTIDEVNENFATTAIFEGADAGLVPSASSSDATKALRGDGTWGDVSNVNVSYNSNDEELHLDFSIGGN